MTDDIPRRTPDTGHGEGDAQPAPPPDSSSPGPHDPGSISTLTSKEREVLGMIGQGLSMQAIADRLFRTLKTIEWYRANLGRKLGARNRVQLARIAMAHGLCPSATAGLGMPTPTMEGPEHIYRAAMALSGTFAFEADLAGLRTYVSPALYAFLGYAPDELGHEPIAMLRVLLPDDFERAVRPAMDLFAHRTSTYESIVRLVRRDATHVVVLVRCAVERTPEGHARVLRGVIAPLPAGAMGVLPPAAKTEHPHPPHSVQNTCVWLRDYTLEQSIVSGVCPAVLHRRPGELYTKEPVFRPFISPEELPGLTQMRLAHLDGAIPIYRSHWNAVVPGEPLRPMRTQALAFRDELGTARFMVGQTVQAPPPPPPGTAETTACGCQPRRVLCGAARLASSTAPSHSSIPGSIEPKSPAPADHRSEARPEGATLQRSTW